MSKHARHDATDRDPEPVRIDKWLWAARIYKTRGLAATAIDSGHVRRGDAEERVKSAHHVKLGERYTVRKDGLRWDIHVLSLSDRRGNADIAATMYSESEASRIARDNAILERRAAFNASGLLRERPTKRDRRQLDQFLHDSE